MDVANMPKVVPIEEREWFVLFSICVAGKSAMQTQDKLNDMLRDMYEHTPYSLNQSAFDTIWWANKQGLLGDYLRKHKMGQYKRIEKAFSEVVQLEVETDLTVEKLEKIPGIGPKTARFIVLYTDPDAEVVPLDTHILKYLAKHYPLSKIPKSTPPAGKKYNQLEILFQQRAKVEGKHVRQLDTEVWQYYAKK
jgi:thermostable 8-oxoguanine DNA glycosylase